MKPSSGSLITTLATQAIHSSGIYTLHFSAVSDSTWVAIGSPAMDSGTHFRVAAAKMNHVIEVVANGFLVPGYYGKKNYRFAYNGKEKVSEIAGEGNHYIYGAREYDPRLNVFWSVDPLTKQYPWYSPYQFAGLSPIDNVDLDGTEEYHYTRLKDNSGKTTRLQLTNVQDIYSLNLNRLKPPSHTGQPMSKERGRNG